MSEEKAYSNKIALVADKNTAMVFRLSGLKDIYPIENLNEAKNIIKKISNDQNIKIILLTENILNNIQEEIDDLIEKKYPIIISISGILDKTHVKRDPLTEIIRRKAGIEFKI